MARTRNAPGTVESMPGVPGPAEQLNDDLEPIDAAPLPSRRSRAAAPPEPTHRLYQVWEHGTLQRDGKVYQPGDTITLPVAEGDAIECLTPAAPR